jgi:alpha,alpha-trehalase
MHDNRMSRAGAEHPIAVPWCCAGASAERVLILTYIKQTWKTLTRSNANLAVAAVDPKSAPETRPLVYVPGAEDFAAIERRIRNAMPAQEFQKIELRVLPSDPSTVREHGLLYLPEPYVVPGGRFNEMYGWDSFFIQMGLLRDGENDLALSLVNNLLYEVREYGKVLNANRTYYLTRSQPPFLTGMTLAVYNRTRDLEWLESSFPWIEKYYRYWTTEPHLTPETGLSRCYDLGDGPAPEVVASEHDGHGKADYDLIREYFRKHKIIDYDVSQYYDAQSHQLTPLFYKADRSMRESGFDPSNRFGPFSIDIIHHNPVCLNSLLYLTETQMAEILSLLNRKMEAANWQKRAGDRAKRINRLMWDEQTGLYCDFEFAHRRLRRYPFLTTFYPLWVGIASPQQAERVVRNLKRFERPGGLQTSEFQSGDQWDAPFGWAPLQWIAAQGLRRYGYGVDADRISKKFLSLANHEFERHGDLEEKYDVVRRTDEVANQLRYGYHSNEAGFGWTYAVFTALFDELTPQDQREVLNQR